MIVRCADVRVGRNDHVTIDYDAERACACIQRTLRAVDRDLSATLTLEVPVATLAALRVALAHGYGVVVSVAGDEIIVTEHAPTTHHHHRRGWRRAVLAVRRGGRTIAMVWLDDEQLDALADGIDRARAHALDPSLVGEVPR